MDNLVILFLCVTLFTIASSAPVRVQKSAEEEKGEQDAEYLRYLGQVVEILEEDEAFKKKLHNASEDDIRTGKIVDDFELLSHKVRTKLDELKRKEVEYQRQLQRQMRDHKNGIEDRQYWNPVHDDNQVSFEANDFHKLLEKHNEMMEEQDKKRREEFHQYEIEKEVKRRKHLESLPEEEKKKELAEYEEQKKNRSKHEKLHEPGSKAQMEETWSEEDGLDPENFDPKTFFKLHDKNGDGFLDMYELETLFLGDVNKVYNESDPNVDPKEREEEIERMREHVVKEMDKDKDGLVSLQEFMDETKDPEYEKDEGWKPLTDEEQYSEDELNDYEKQHNDLGTEKDGEHDVKDSHEPEEHKAEEHHEQKKEEHHEQKKEEHHEQKKEEHH